MAFTEEQRYQTLRFLNQALLRIYKNDYGVRIDKSDRTHPRYPFLLEKTDIWAKLDAVESESEILVDQVVEVLTNLQTVEQNIIKIRSDSNYAIKRADVVEFDIDRKTQGMDCQRDELIESLRYLLGLPASPNNYSGGMLLLG